MSVGIPFDFIWVYINFDLFYGRCCAKINGTKIHYSRKVGSYIDISVTGLIVMMSILESQQKILKRGTRNISRPHPPYMTILTPLVMMSPLTTFPYWGERTITS